MKRKIFFILLVCLIVSCNQKPSLYIKTRTIVKNTKTDTEEISIVKSDYFEVFLYLNGSGTGYIAKKDLEKHVTSNNFKAVYFNIVDKNGEVILFNSSMEFLNFMSERGYEMVDQAKDSYQTNYTFKKK